jgi:hypothetical protein
MSFYNYGREKKLSTGDRTNGHGVSADVTREQVKIHERTIINRYAIVKKKT